MDSALAEFFPGRSKHIGNAVGDVTKVPVEEWQLRHLIGMKIGKSTEIAMAASLGNKHAGGVDAWPWDRTLINGLFYTGNGSAHIAHRCPAMIQKKFCGDSRFSANVLPIFIPQYSANMKR